MSKDFGLEEFLNGLSDTKREVLYARAGGKSLRETAAEMGVTDNFIAQAEAKIERAFTKWARENDLFSKLVGLKNDDLGERREELLYLLLRYKQSFFYSGELAGLSIELL